MNSRGCLDWCLEYQGQYPTDFKTCLHVVDWLAESARKIADSQRELSAIRDAEIFAHTSIALYRASCPQ